MHAIPICAAYETSLSMSFIPRGSHTKVVIDEIDGTYKVMQLSEGRRLIREAMSAVRLCVSAFLTYQGTQYLIYTIAVEELLLNAVALEFVITLDELVFQSLAPAHTKRVVARSNHPRWTRTHISQHVQVGDHMRMRGTLRLDTCRAEQVLSRFRARRRHTFSYTHVG